MTLFTHPDFKKTKKDTYALLVFSEPYDGRNIIYPDNVYICFGKEVAEKHLRDMKKRVCVSLGSTLRNNGRT